MKNYLLCAVLICLFNNPSYAIDFNSKEYKVQLIKTAIESGKTHNAKVNVLDDVHGEYSWLKNKEEKFGQCVSDVANTLTDGELDILVNIKKEPNLVWLDNKVNAKEIECINIFKAKTIFSENTEDINISPQKTDEQINNKPVEVAETNYGMGNWIFIDITDDKQFTTYLDMSRLQKNNDFVSIWKLLDSKKSFEGIYSNTAELQFNCKSKTISWLQSINYTKNMGTGESQRVNDFDSNPKGVIPNSKGEEMLNYACGYTKISEAAFNNTPLHNWTLIDKENLIYADLTPFKKKIASNQ